MKRIYYSPASRTRDLCLEGSLCKSQLHDFQENDFFIEEDGNN